MKSLSSVFGVLLVSTLCTTSCKQKPLTISSEPIEWEQEREEEEEDGIREAQEQDFENTRDIQLGYIPLDRLSRTVDRLNRERRMSRGANTNALTWVERGPNSDAIGSSNGNTRGPGSTSVTSGRIRAVWIDLNDPTNHTVWAGSVSGGLWKTTNISASPANWVPVNDNLGNLAISSICQDPSSTNIMYYGTGEKTYNVDAVRGGGIWRSTDNGATWSLMAGTSGFYNVSRIACDASGNLYVAMIGANGVQRYNKAAGTWTNITPSGLTSLATDLRISSTGRLHVVCGYRNSGISGYRFTDNPATVTSATWTSPTTTFPTAYNTELAVSGNNLYSLPASSTYQTPTVYRSTDGGDNWTATTSMPAAISSGQGWYNIALGFDPANPNTIVAGGLNTFRSTNGGTSWTQVAAWVGTSMPYVHADQHFVTWNGNEVIMASDGGLFYSTDGGVTWADRNVGLRIKQFYSCAIHPTSTNYMIAGAQDNGMHQLNSAGLGASVEFVGGDGMLSHIDQDEPQYQFGAYVYNDYRRSTNNGVSWSSVTYSQSLGQFVNPSDYDDGNNRMYAATSAGQYLRWENPQSGATFNTVSVAAFSGGTVNTVSVSPYTSNRVFFGTTNGQLVRVDNAHQASPTATSITGSSMNASSVSCVAVGTTDNHLIATFSNFGATHVWMSTTGGGASGWTNISGNLPDIPVRWAMFYPYDNTKAMLATDAGIFETDLINGASTVWTQNTSFPSVRTNMLQFRSQDNTIVAATHGRGLWTSIADVATPYVRFAVNYASGTEAKPVVTGCRGYRDYTVNMQISKAPTGTATITLTTGGTATPGLDFDVTTNGNFAAPSNVLSFANGSTTPQTVTIRVYDDIDVEAAEVITLGYTISGTTDAVAGPNYQAYSFAIGDNDLAPVAPGAGSATIGTGGFSGVTQPFRGGFEKAKNQFIYLASELSAAGLSAGNITAIGMNITTKTSTGTFNGLTISMKNTGTAAFGSVAFESGASQVYSGNVTTTSGLNTFTLSTPFVWDGSSNVLVEICYDNPTGTIPGGSGDIVSAHATADCKGVWQRQSTGTGCSITAGFNQFSSTFVRPDMTFSATVGNQIETVLNANRTEYVGGAGTYYFFNASNANILASLNGVSANLGCVTTNIMEAGNTWQSFQGGQRSGKVYTITPTTNTGASYTVSLYFTTAELAGKAPASLRIAKTTAATMAGANSSNTVSSATTFTPFGSGYMFTANFTGFSNFFLADNTVILPAGLLTFTGRLNGNTSVLDWSTSTEQNTRNFQVEKSTDGVNYFAIGSVPAAGNSNTRRNYSFVDRQLTERNYYRLRTNDQDGQFKYSQIVLLQTTARQNLWVVNNPFGSYLDLRVARAASRLELQLVSPSGAVVARKLVSGANGQIRWNLPANLAKGSYVLHAIVDGESFTQKLVKQ